MEPTSVTKAMIRIVSVDREDRPHYLAIYGSKLTTYRATADCVMQRMLPVLPGGGRLADTRNISL